MAAQFSKIFGAEGEAGDGQAKTGASEAKENASTTEAAPAAEHNREKDVSQYETVLGAGCSVEGRLVCKGPARLSGSIKGEIQGDGMVAIDEGAVVTADVNVREASIGGRVIGNVNAVSRVTLGSTALIDGDIRTPSLSIAEGAQIMGRIEVKPGAGEQGQRAKSSQPDVAKPDAAKSADLSNASTGADRG